MKPALQHKAFDRSRLGPFKLRRKKTRQRQAFAWVRALLQDGMPSGSSPTRLQSALIFAAPLAAVFGLWSYAMSRVYTYVTAQDPFWYIGLARTLLNSTPGSQEMAHGLSFVSPGYPLLLAGAIACFGEFAPYWFNFVLGMFLFVAYATLIVRITGNMHDTGLVLALSLYVWVTAYYLNTHFLLYPFRGTPIYLLMLVGYLLLHWGHDRHPATAWTLAAGLCFAAAIAIRETAVLGLVGAALWLAWTFRGAAARRHIGVLLAPMIAGLLLLFVIGFLHERPVNSQMSSWSRLLTSKSPLQLLADMQHTGVTMAGFLWDGVHAWGALLLAVGIWKSMRRPALICFFIVPAALLYGFYCLYIPHQRYFLTVLVFLSPVLCLGLLHLIQIACRPIAKRIPRAEAAMRWLVAIILAGLTWGEITKLEPWERRVTREDVRAFQSDMQGLAGDRSLSIYHERTCRYLGDAATCFTDASLPNPKFVRGALAEGERCLYFQPLNRDCHYEGYLHGVLSDSGVTTEKVLRHFCELTPLLNDMGQTQSVSIARGTFAVFEAAPHEETVRTFQPRPRAGRPHVFWLDFGAGSQDQIARVRLVDGNETVLFPWTEVPARGIQGVAVAGSRLPTSWVGLEVESDQPLPENLLLTAQVDERPARFVFDGNRSLSTHRWFRAPFVIPAIRHTRIGVFKEGGTLLLPSPAGDPVHAMTLSLTLRPVAQTEDVVNITYRHNNREIASFEGVNLSQRLIRHALTVPNLEPDTGQHVEVLVHGKMASQQALQIARAGIYYDVSATE